jgi:RNA polymerase sigma-70 factor (ECF subfamily)
MTDAAHAVQARALVAAMAMGDRMALSRLITLYGRGVQIYCHRALHQPQDAEDATQETFLRAWAAAARYDPAKAAVTTWLYRIAVNLCIDRNRRHALRRWIGLDRPDDLPEPPSDDIPAEQSLAARQMLAQVRQHITTLPDRQRQALLLRAVAGMDTAQIAAVMGSGTGAVEQLLVRARASLRSRMGPDFDLD